MGKFNLAEHIQKAQPAQVRDIEVITTEILDAKRAGGEAILTIGRGLLEAKALLSHGEWLPWLEERVEFSEKAAQNFMRLARHYSNSQTLADLGSSKALMLLAVPEEERDDFISVPHEVGGQEKSVAEMSVRELQTAIKERDEARRALAQAQAGQAAAEAARDKASQDMELANRRLAGLNAQLAEQSARAEDAQAAAQRLAAELEELKASPVDMVVETDANALHAARREAEAAMQAQVDEAKSAAEQARAELMEANSAVQRARLEQEQARQELERAKAEAAALREGAEGKRAALAADGELALFRALFEQTQGLAKKLGGMLTGFRARDPEKAPGLSKALLALADKIREAAQ